YTTTVVGSDGSTQTEVISGYPSTDSNGDISATTSVGGPASTVVTVNSCLQDACSETEVTTGLTTITETVSGVQTVFTTYCPLTSDITLSTATLSEAVSTTVVTVTSCSDSVCVESTVTRGATLSTATTSTKSGLGSEATSTGSASATTLATAAGSEGSASSSVATSSTASVYEGSASTLTSGYLFTFISFIMVFVF
ncbi:Yeast-form wall Protein 1, partial [Cyberlindnera fabianii]